VRALGLLPLRCSSACQPNGASRVGTGARLRRWARVRLMWMRAEAGNTLEAVVSLAALQAASTNRHWAGPLLVGMSARMAGLKGRKDDRAAKRQSPAGQRTLWRVAGACTLVGLGNHQFSGWLLRAPAEIIENKTDLMSVLWCNVQCTLTCIDEEALPNLNVGFCL